MFELSFVPTVNDDYMNIRETPEVCMYVRVHVHVHLRVCTLTTHVHNS